MVSYHACPGYLTLSNGILTFKHSALKKMDSVLWDNCMLLWLLTINVDINKHYSFFQCHTDLQCQSLQCCVSLTTFTSMTLCMYSENSCNDKVLQGLQMLLRNT